MGTGIRLYGWSFDWGIQGVFEFDAPLSFREPRATHRHYPADVVRIKACYFSKAIKRLAAAARSGSAISGTGANGYS